jgi:glycosyltransferase involved in cell wall biosynthesis
LSERVRFLGSRPHEEIPALLAAADVMVLPTVAEGLANVWVESLACGTPVVTTDIPGAAEAVDSECGRLVSRSPEAVAGAVRELLAAPIASELIRRKAERFSWQRNSAELVDHLTRIVGRSEKSKAA